MVQWGKENPHYGRGGRRWRGLGGARKTTLHATLAPPLGEIIATVQHDDLEESASQEDDTAQITNSQYLASYNWLTGADPHIIVPGEMTNYLIIVVTTNQYAFTR